MDDQIKNMDYTMIGSGGFWPVAGLLLGRVPGVSPADMTEAAWRGMELRN